MNHTSPGRPLRRRRTAFSTAALVAGGGLLVLAPTPAAAAITTATPPQIAAAMAGPGADVTGAGYVSVANPNANGVGDSALSTMPTHGPTFSVLTTGLATTADTANTSSSTGTGLGGGQIRGTNERDVTILKVDLSVPASANCLSFDFKFFSEEYFEYVGTQFNDAFIAELDDNTWTTSGTSTISAPDNFAFDGSGNVISVNATGVGTASSAQAAGTTYDAATPLLSAATTVTPGAHSLYLSIFDQGDAALDSATFVDNLRVGFVPDPATQCVSGAQVKQYQLDLAPADATLETGQQHTVTASLQDLNATPPALPGATILFQATGANAASGSDTTDASGEATFSYTGTGVGDDAIGACYDVDSSGTCDAGEPFASAQASWTNAAPSNDAGGPYAGDEGSEVALSGTAEGGNPGDALISTWSHAPGAGVDAGASCAFTDASDPTTTVSCTDDGTYELTLTTSDGVHADVTDTAELTIDNVAPEVDSITTPVAPVAVGTPVPVSATYSDPGSNDTHAARIEWGDGATSSPAASGGSLSGSHLYTSAGIHTVCVTVTDDDEASDRECAESYVVVYDPSAGFVTGGGWITAAPGSLPADPSASGPGRFGFVSKYKKGAQVPDGSTEFQFQAGGLNFHSSSYQWLVVAGSKAMYKGSGTLNGAGDHSFLVSAVDGGKGGADRFRIKIWETASGTVVFDNQVGDGDGAAAANAITQGSIVVHG